jgi:hypothetical protein
MAGWHNGYVQYGCGLSAPPGWTNFDTSPTLRLQKVPVIGAMLTRKGPVFPKNVLVGDIVRGLPVPETSCDAVYCSHVLEHLSLEDCRTALKHTYSYLKPRGIFRLVVPDLEYLARAYLASEKPQPALEFLESISMGRTARPRNLRGFLRDWLGNSQHLWMWDYRSFSVELSRVGFRDVRRASFGDSPDPHFAEVEERSRWDNCLGIECRKPAAGD